MPNTDWPHGLREVGTVYGGPSEVEEFAKVVGYGTAIFIGDAVNRVADGSIEASATPGTTLYSGVALNYGAVSTATTHQVIVSQGTIFEAQDNNATDGIAAVDLGLNANLQLNAGSTTTQLSGHEINETGIDTTNTLDVHLRRLYPISGNVHGAWARIEIQFNMHRMGTTSVGV
jgi:hypothetical protein